MTVYADVVFAVNFLFNAEMLLLSHKLQTVKVSPVRVIISALIGGMASVAVFVPYLQAVCHVAARYLLPFLMSLVCSYPCCARTVLIRGIVLFLVSFFFSGMMNFFGMGVFSGMILAMPAYGAISLWSRRKRKRYKEITVKYRGKTVKLRGFCDSGNLLEYMGNPVILADESVFESLFGAGFCISGICEWVRSEDIRYVPYCALGKSGVVPGVRLDMVSIEEKQYPGVILACSGKNFSEKLILNSVMCDVH